MTDRLCFAIPGDLASPTGGYAYDRRMIAELGAQGWEVDVVSLGAGFPSPSESDLRAAGEAFAAIADGALVLVDGLAFGAMPTVAEAHAGRLRLVALVHHPLALETGLGADAAKALEASERRALRSARLAVATSAATARDLTSDFAMAATRIRVAVPGTDPAPVSPGTGATPLILSAGAVVPRKGHRLLVEALAGLADLRWRCRIVGALDRDPGEVAHVRGLIEAAGLGTRIALVGQAQDVRSEMAAADLFVLPTFHEGYGMVFAEAMSQGLPVVGTHVGALPDLVPESAGVLVSPGDVEALGRAIRALLEDADLRRSRRDGALAAGARLPDWAASARSLADTLREAAR